MRSQGMSQMRIGICVLLLVAGLLTAAGCAALSKKESAPARHPEELGTGWANCLECHEDENSGALKPYGSFVHTSVFLRQHGLYSSRDQNLCASCHRVDFCQTCHAADEELKPGIRQGNRPDLAMPHRGDYLVQHQIDGRVDPGSCVGCHGRRNNDKCAVCH